MSLSNLITNAQRQQLDAAYAKTADCLARYKRCKGVLETNAKFADGKTRTREWLEGITDTAERERCRTVLNNIITAKRHYAAVKASGQLTEPSTTNTAPAMPTPAEREALRQAVANRIGGKGNV